MPNIKFSYLYRDGANYKKHGYIIFDNPTNVELATLKVLITSNLIYGEWFYAEEWNLPELFLKQFDLRVDPTWHEFECIEHTFERPHASFSIEKLMASIKKR